MGRPDLTDTERSYLDEARTVLAASRALDVADDREVARMVGRLEVIATQLLRIADPDGDDGAVA